MQPFEDAANSGGTPLAAPRMIRALPKILDLRQRIGSSDRVRHVLVEAGQRTSPGSAA